MSLLQGFSPLSSKAFQRWEHTKLWQLPGTKTSLGELQALRFLEAWPCVLALEDTCSARSSTR